MESAVFFDQVRFFGGDDFFEGIVAGFGGNGGVEAIEGIPKPLGEDGVRVGFPFGLGTVRIGDDIAKIAIAEALQLF